MVEELTIQGKKAEPGARMTKGRGWRLAATTGRRRVFRATLLEIVNHGSKRLAIFSVPK